MRVRKTIKRIIALRRGGSGKYTCPKGTYRNTETIGREEGNYSFNGIIFEVDGFTWKQDNSRTTSLFNETLYTGNCLKKPRDVQQNAFLFNEFHLRIILFCNQLKRLSPVSLRCSFYRTGVGHVK